MTISWVKKPEHVSQLWLPLGRNQDLTAWGNCRPFCDIRQGKMTDLEVSFADGFGDPPSHASTPKTEHQNGVTAMRACLLALAALALLPATSFGDEPPAQDDDKQFTMMKGQGVPVCEAYLDVLNRTPLERTPFCSRPENGPAPFVPLERRYLEADEILPLFNYVWEFMRFDDQHHVERVFHPNQNPKLSYWSADVETREGIAEFLGRDWMHVWTYATPIDIDNDSKPVRLLIWQGYGVSRSGASCGVDYASGPWDGTYTEQRVFVLSADGRTIDESQTRAIFGRAGIGPSTGSQSTQPRERYSSLPTGATPFQPIADSIGIFGYDGHYYIQTENKPASRGAAPPSVEVFLRDQAHTTKVCAFRPQAVPVPE
jgi:hypothetical protein